MKGTQAFHQFSLFLLSSYSRVNVNVHLAVAQSIQQYKTLISDITLMPSSKTDLVGTIEIKPMTYKSCSILLQHIMF